jgi:FixJ family two-component response regulator
MLNEAMVHVIDDDEAVRQSLEFLLASADLHVRTYDSAKTFLDGLRKIESGCVITDVRMPEMTGIQLLQHLQEMQAREKMKVGASTESLDLLPSAISRSVQWTPMT